MRHSEWKGWIRTWLDAKETASARSVDCRRIICTGRAMAASFGKSQTLDNLKQKRSAASESIGGMVREQSRVRCTGLVNGSQGTDLAVYRHF